MIKVGEVLRIRNIHSFVLPEVANIFGNTRPAVVRRVVQLGALIDRRRIVISHSFAAEIVQCCL
jgi:hypothetical protein